MAGGVVGVCGGLQSRRWASFLPVALLVYLVLHYLVYQPADLSATAVVGGVVVAPYGDPSSSLGNHTDRGVHPASGTAHSNSRVDTSDNVQSISVEKVSVVLNSSPEYSQTSLGSSTIEALHETADSGARSFSADAVGGSEPFLGVVSSEKLDSYRKISSGIDDPSPVGSSELNVFEDSNADEVSDQSKLRASTSDDSAVVVPERSVGRLLNAVHTGTGENSISFPSTEARNGMDGPAVSRGSPVPDGSALRGRLFVPRSATRGRWRDDLAASSVHSNALDENSVSLNDISNDDGFQGGMNHLNYLVPSDIQNPRFKWSDQQPESDDYNARDINEEPAMQVDDFRTNTFNNGVDDRDEVRDSAQRHKAADGATLVLSSGSNFKGPVASPESQNNELKKPLVGQELMDSRSNFLQDDPSAVSNMNSVIDDKLVMKTALPSAGESRSVSKTDGVQNVEAVISDVALKSGDGRVESGDGVHAPLGDSSPSDPPNPRDSGGSAVRVSVTSSVSTSIDDSNKQSHPSAPAAHDKSNQETNPNSAAGQSSEHNSSSNIRSSSRSNVISSSNNTGTTSSSSSNSNGSVKGATTGGDLAKKEASPSSAAAAAADISATADVTQNEIIKSTAGTKSAVTGDSEAGAQQVPPATGQEPSVPQPAVAASQALGKTAASGSRREVLRKRIKKPTMAIDYLKGKSKVGDHYHPGFAVAHEELCPNNGRDLKVLVFITTAPDHEKHRTAVRQTWGHFALRKDVLTVFMVGTTTKPQVQAGIDRENERFGDIVQSNSADHYGNLTLKTTAMFEWVKTYCSEVPFVLKTDDDMYINMPLLFAFIDSKKKEKRVMYGRLAKGWKPVRSKKSKYYVDMATYSKTTYPDFVTGPAYLFTSDIVEEMYHKILETDFFFLEDVLITGIIGENLKVRRIGDSRFRNEKIKISETCKLMQTISIHMVKYEEQFDIYKRTLDGKTKCKPK